MGRTTADTWAFGASDDPPRETVLSGRLRRAFANYLETVPAALVVLIADELSDPRQRIHLIRRVDMVS